MTLDVGTLSLLVFLSLAAIVVLAVWVAMLQRSEARLRLRLRRLLADGEKEGLDEVLDRALGRVDGLAKRVEAQSALHRELAGITERSLQRVGIVRFNPFADTGGDQSFALALLDAQGNGLVVSSLHSRSDTRVFAKAVSAGHSTHQLSDEEQGAIRQAMTSKGS